jgi:hypothetical protein
MPGRSDIETLVSNLAHGNVHNRHNARNRASVGIAMTKEVLNPMPWYWLRSAAPAALYVVGSLESVLAEKSYKPAHKLTMIEREKWFFLKVAPTTILATTTQWSL